MIKMRMSYHASVERIDRLTALIQHLGFNEIAYETIDNQNPDHIISITDTGIILIRGRQDGTLVTGYMGTIDKVIAICHGNVPVALKRTVVRNCKKYSFLLGMQGLTKFNPCVIIRVQKAKELRTMKYLVKTRIGCEVLDTYELAEIFCFEQGIHPEEIVEVTDEEAAEICG